MNVFISWSGKRSHAVAEVLKNWIEDVHQLAKPWLSSRDIDRGDVWFGKIQQQLKDTSVGIICLTQENKNAPWILFEAGALAKTQVSVKVITLLIDLAKADVEGPLAHFNHTLPNVEEMWQLVRTLNSCLNEGKRDEIALRRAFDTWWPGFDSGFAKALQTPSAEAAPRSSTDILAEILENTRALRAQSTMPVDLFDPSDAFVTAAELRDFVSKASLGGFSPSEIEKMIVKQFRLNKLLARALLEKHLGLPPMGPESTEVATSPPPTASQSPRAQSAES